MPDHKKPRIVNSGPVSSVHWAPGVMPPHEGRILLAKYLTDGDVRHLAQFVREGFEIPRTAVWRGIFANVIESDVPKRKPSRFKKNVLRDLEIYLEVVAWRECNRKSNGKLPTVLEALHALPDEFEGDLQGQYKRGAALHKKITRGEPIA